MTLFNRINRLFPVWAVLLCVVAVIWPGLFTGFDGLIQPLLAVVMFAMGLTLSREDFLRVLRAPLPVFIGVVLQFMVMPLAALGISLALGLDAALTAGMVLVGATAGGTASNFMTWLAGGRVALSVSMTLTSTLVAVVLTPFISWLLLSETVEVAPWDMLLSILRMVVAPVVLGVAVHHWFSDTIRAVESALATLAMLVIIFIIAIVVALNAGQLSALGPLVALGVVTHNAVGLLGGYWISRGLGVDEATARTVAIEVGMQNSGLAVALANQFFSPAAALPGALFSIWHNISGSMLAAYWHRRPPPEAAIP